MNRHLYLIIFFFLLFITNASFADTNIKEDEIIADKEKTLTKVNLEILHTIDKMSGRVTNEQMHKLLTLIDKFKMYKLESDALLTELYGIKTRTSLNYNILEIYFCYNRFLPGDREGKVAMLLSELNGNTIETVEAPILEILFKSSIIFFCLIVGVVFFIVKDFLLGKFFLLFFCIGLILVFFY